MKLCGRQAASRDSTDVREMRVVAAQDDAYLGGYIEGVTVRPDTMDRFRAKSPFGIFTYPKDQSELVAQELIKLAGEIRKAHR